MSKQLSREYAQYESEILRKKTAYGQTIKITSTRINILSMAWCNGEAVEGRNMSSDCALIN